MVKYSVKTGDAGRVKCIMHVLLAAALVLQAATVIDVQANHTVTLGLHFGDIVYSAEFSPRDLKPDSLKEGERVQAKVKRGHMTVQRKDGRRVTGGSSRYSACSFIRCHERLEWGA